MKTNSQQTKFQQLATTVTIYETHKKRFIGMFISSALYCFQIAYIVLTYEYLVILGEPERRYAFLLISLVFASFHLVLSLNADLFLWGYLVGVRNKTLHAKSLVPETV